MNDENQQTIVFNPVQRSAYVAVPRGIERAARNRSITVEVNVDVDYTCI
jgi:hypothetical protein